MPDSWPDLLDPPSTLFSRRESRVGNYSVMPTKLYLPTAHAPKAEQAKQPGIRPGEALPRDFQVWALEILKRDQAPVCKLTGATTRIARELALLNLPPQRLNSVTSANRLSQSVRLRLGPDRHASGPRGIPPFEVFQRRAAGLLRSLAVSSLEATDNLRELDQ